MKKQTLAKEKVKKNGGSGKWKLKLFPLFDSILGKDMKERKMKK